MKLSAKNKIILMVAVWVIITVAAFNNGFHLFDSSNGLLVSNMDKQKTELYSLRAEQDSYQKAKLDLQNVAKEPYQPDDFFSKDISLVNEIKTLEGVGQKLNVNLVLSGISGTIKNASPTKTKSGVLYLPYSIAVTGNLPDVVKLIETLEHLSFVTDIGSVAMAPAANKTVSAVFTAQFYLHK